MSIIHLDKTEFVDLLGKFRAGSLDERAIEKLIRFAEFNHHAIEARFTELWGKDSVTSMYVDFVIGCEKTFNDTGDVRFANVFLKVSATKMYKSLVKSGVIKQNDADVLNGLFV